MLNFAVTNIANINSEIILWHRVGKDLKVFRDKSFRPYFYQLANNGIYKTIDGKRVNKVMCYRPSDVKNKRDENSYEADILYCKRYILDRIGAFSKADLKYSFIDIEVLCPELPNYLDPKYPISCISCSNNYTGEIKTFFLLDYREFYYNDEKGGILTTERHLLNDFTQWIREQQFDLSLGWNFVLFDYRYLCARYKRIFNVELAEILSPIAQAKYLGSQNREEQPILIPAGTSVLDYLDMYKKIYKTEPAYDLDSIALKELNQPKRKKIDFNKLTEDIKIKNREDVRLLMELDKKKNIINYYDELRRMSTCEWSDTTWNSKMLDMILLREAKQKNIILPSKKYGQDLPEEETSFEGAYRRCNIMDKEDNIIKKCTGLHKNVFKLDLSSAYPGMIIEFCLDIANLSNDKGIDVNGTKFYQNKNALLPSVALKLINKKDLLKKELKSLNPETEEYRDLQTKYDAQKAVVNSLFGICGLKIFRLFNYKIASSITYLVRDLLHYVENRLIEQNIEIIYIDTDSFFIQAKNNPTELCNQLIQLWAKEKYNKENVNIAFDLEGKFSKLFIISLCHYKGFLETKAGIKEEIKGIECLDPNVIIPTSKGYKYLKDINVGEKIFTARNSFTKVVEKAESIHKKYLQIKVEAKLPINCSINHKFFVVRHNRELLLYAKDIRVGDYLLEIPYISKNNKNYFSTTLALILGFFYSEGYIDKKNLLRFTFHKKEIDIIKILKKAIQKLFHIEMNLYPSYNKSKAIVLQKQHKEFLKLKRILHINKRIASSCKFHKLPISLLLAPKSAIQVFLKALFTGDGCLYKNKIIYETISKELFEGTKFLLKRCNIGFSERIAPINLKIKRPNIAYRIEIGKNEFYKYYHQIGFFGRKEQLLKKELLKKFDITKNQRNHLFNGLLLKKVKTIRFINKKIKLIDITTESGDFLCDYLKVHNSKRKDSSHFIKIFQTDLLDKIMNEQPKEEIIKWILSEKERIKTLPLIDVAFPCKKSAEEGTYKSVPIFMRALRYTQELIKFEKRIGDSFYWIPVENFGTDVRKSTRMKKNKETGIKELQCSEKEINRNILAFDEDNFNHIKVPNWEEIIRKSITDKCEAIFEALEWDLSEIQEIKIKKQKEIITAKEISDIDNQIQELQNKKEQLQQSKFAGEVSKKTCGTSSSESSVQVANPAPYLENETIKKFREIQNIKAKIKIEESFNKNDVEMKKITFQEAKQIIIENHYSHTMPVTNLFLGFYYKNRLNCIIVYGSGASYRLATSLPNSNFYELVRLFSFDNAPKNMESYCISQSFKYIKKHHPEIKVLVSFADPSQGHLGYIYQATNWIYTGLTLQAGNAIYEVNGTKIHPRTLLKKYNTTSKNEALEMLKKDNPDAIIKQVTNTRKHRYIYFLGNHKENKDMKKNLKYPQLPYPKIKNALENDNIDSKQAIEELKKRGVIK